jgi:hypothetical protein
MIGCLAADWLSGAAGRHNELTARVSSKSPARNVLIGGQADEFDDFLQAAARGHTPAR